MKKVNKKKVNKKHHKELIRRVERRLMGELKTQSGGSCNLSSSGTFRNVIDQLACMVEDGVLSIVKGAEFAGSVMTLPADLAWDMSRPNEPMPHNTPVEKIELESESGIAIPNIPMPDFSRFKK